MNLGSALLRPQRLERHVALSHGVDTDMAVVEDLLSLVSRLLLDSERASPLMRVLLDVMDACQARFVERVTGRFDTAAAHIYQMLQPLETFIGELQPPEGKFTADTVLQDIQKLLDKLATETGNLTVNRIESLLQPLVDVLQVDLQITPDVIENEIWALVDDMITGLDNVPDSATLKERQDRRDLSAVLRRLKQRFQGSFKLPDFDLTNLARQLVSLLSSTNLEAIIRQVACTFQNVGQGVNSLEDLKNAIASEISASASVGAAADSTDNAGDFSWYATWLLEGKGDDVPLFKPGDLKNAAQLVQKLKAQANEPSTYIYNQCNDEQKSLIDGYSGSGEPDEDTLLMLMEVFNSLIQGPSLFYKDAFSGVNFSDKTRLFWEDYEDSRALVRLNRMVVEDAYSDELDPMNRSDIWEGFGGFLKYVFGLWEGDWWQAKGSALGQALLGLIGWPGEQVRVDSSGKRVLMGNKIMHVGENAKWHEAPIFNSEFSDDGRYFYTFKVANNEVMEWTAFITAILRDTAVTVWHSTQAIDQPGHRAASIINGIYDLGHGLNTGIAGKPFSGYDTTPFYRWTDFFLELIEARGGLPFLGLFAASFQGKHTAASGANITAFWFTVLMGDFVKYIGPLTTTNLARNALLSFMTLLNFPTPWGSGPSTLPRSPAQNNKEQDGMVALVEALFGLWLVSYVKKEDYVHPFRGQMPDEVWKLWLLGGMGMGLFAGFTGTVVSATVAWAEDWKLLGITMLKSMFKMPVMFLPLLYSSHEGKTDDGHFNPTGGPEFNGYPAKPSPYLLPYASGSSINIGQAHAGFWSHNVPTNPASIQTYAVDFALDQAVEILASRPGTVVSFFEGTVDDTTGPWNNIIIRHDVDDDGNPVAPDAVHDLDAGGTPVVTFAVYGHGRQNGVTAAFARWATPVPTASIVGTQVKRGQPIMLAGDTGNSWYNHCHMHILPRNASPGYTIPFIYDDVPGDGVPKALSWYTSTNTRITS